MCVCYTLKEQWERFKDINTDGKGLTTCRRIQKDEGAPKLSMRRVGAVKERQKPQWNETKQKKVRRGSLVETELKQRC